MGKIKEAAFRGSDGHVVGTGPFHDISDLPEDFQVAEEGFLDQDGNFLSRDDAAKEVGIDHPIESEEIGLQKSLKDYDFEGPHQDPATPSQLRIRALLGGKEIGSLTFAAKPNQQENSPHYGFHTIGQADVHPLHRGEGVYGRMLQLAALHVKKALKSRGLVSRGEWRSEAASGAWQRLANKNKVTSRPSHEPDAPDFFMSEQENLEKRSKNVREQTRNISPETAQQRILRYIRSRGIRTQKIPARNGFGVDDKGSYVKYTPDLEPEHEMGHAMMTPSGQNLNEQQESINKLKELSDPDYDDLVATQIQHGIARRAGVAPRGSFVQTHMDLQDPDSDLYDPHNGKNYAEGIKKLVSRVPAAQKDAHAYLDQFDSGLRRIDPKTGVVGSTNSVDSKINARAMGKSEADETSSEYIEHEWEIEYKRWLAARLTGGELAKAEYKIQNIPLNQLVVNRDSLMQAHDNVSRGRGSQTVGPISVWRANNGSYLLTDGHHRLVHHLLSAQHGGTIPANIIGEGDSDYYFEPTGRDRAALNPNEKYGGMESVADDSVLATDSKYGRVLTPTRPPEDHFDFNKAEQDLESFLHVRDTNLYDAPSADAHEVARQMAGYDQQSSPEFQAARFLAGGKSAPEDAIRVALILYDNDFELAALRAYGLPRNDKYRELLHSIMDMQRFVPLQAQVPSQPVHSEISKNEINPPAIPRDIRAGNPDAEEVAQALKRAQAERQIEDVQLDPKAKHSKGMSIATDSESHDKWLIKPGSGNLSPAAGVREEPANQSLREVAFYKIAKAVGLGEFLPETELILMDGSDVAVMKLLDPDFKGVDKVRQKDKVDPVDLFGPYLEDGSLYKWALLDWVLGNPDRHANNVMVNLDHDKIKLIDHGSAFAGPSFNPAFDSKSFTPCYLRAWYSGNWSELDPAERFDELPKLSNQRTQEFNDWVKSINSTEIQQILASYGIAPEAVMTRLKQIQNSDDPAQTLMEMWSGLTS